MYLSVIIPAYNEEKRVGRTLEAIGSYLARQSFDYEVIVVNNRSKDGTADVVKKFQEKFPRIRLMNENHAGKGFAVRKGMLEAKGEFRLFTDADNSTTIDHIEKMMPYFKQGYDIVIGSLAVKGAKVVRGEPGWRVLLGKLGNKWIQVFAVWGINDTQRGFKIFTAKSVEKIFSQVTIFGWGFDIEVLALAKKYKYWIKEVPVTWDNDPESKVSVWAYPQVLMQTLKVFWNMRTGAYN
ncbi:MAG: dolichyl-phosphate beta-glucosyltransferase [Patescibacteria group bacterium]|mgnify:FL=1